ncbi:hypothetical protein [Rhodoferax sp.]|uniref:hypothetical protein n=1 Tax=Rhodoferax sp. TaxID=50421 RepID=UPI00374DA70A
MNFEPFAPFESSEALPPTALEPHLAAHYFDRPGLVWIAACLLFATTAGRWLPVVSEPDAWHQGLVAIGWADASPARVATAPQPEKPRQQPTRAHYSDQADARPLPAELRQF